MSGFFGRPGSNQPQQYPDQQRHGSQQPYRQAPQGYQQAPPQGYGQAPPQGYPQGQPQGYGSSHQKEKEKATHIPGEGPILGVEKAPKQQQYDLVYGNLCAVSSHDFPANSDGPSFYILIQGGEPYGEFVLTAIRDPSVPRGSIYLSDVQRTWVKITLKDKFRGKPFDPFTSQLKPYLGTMDVGIWFASQNKKSQEKYDEDELAKMFIKKYQNQVLAPGQVILMDVRNIPLRITINSVCLVDYGKELDDPDRQTYTAPNARGILTNQTRVLFHREGIPELQIQLLPSKINPKANAIVSPSFKFEDMGIGGLGAEFSTIFRRAFASRVFSPGIVARMGIPHVKGMLLYGPPGTGKTLIARQIGQMLNAREPKVINGPEVLNKYVGQSEENIRKLFEDAEKEYKEKGDESELHIIIFDELDAVCKQRGSGAGGGTGVGDSVVNQLLSKLDGVNQLNNILLIGMTNRKDMIDEALMRPGRLEVHIEISLPDEAGRLEILKIHTNKMRQNKLLNDDVNLEELAEQTKNFSGAEISGLVKAAASVAFSRHTAVGELGPPKGDATKMQVEAGDFRVALTEVRPAYGVSEADLDEAVRLGITKYSQHVQTTMDEMERVVSMIKEDPRKFSTSVLFHGPRGSGKTALAAYIAKISDFPFVKMITPSNLVGYRDEFAKKDYVHKAFADAYKSPASILILDDFERLIGWNPIGPRFSNTMLEALTTLLVSKPPKGHRLLIFVTTSRASVLNMLEIDTDFAKKVAVPAISNLHELAAFLREYKEGEDSYFNSTSVDHVIRMIHERRGSDTVGVGVKTALDCIFEARAGGNQNVLETLSELLIEKIQDVGM